jgi:phosphoacetylglucosamine mutase
MVEGILRRKQWSYLDWAALYEDLPSRLSTLLVEDRSVVTTTNTESCCLTPMGLQAAIDKQVALYSRGRAFVRASGTEDLMRVYAEADTRANCDRLSLDVLKLVHEFAGGLGDPPSCLV